MIREDLFADKPIGCGCKTSGAAKLIGCGCSAHLQEQGRARAMAERWLA